MMMMQFINCVVKDTKRRLLNYILQVQILMTLSYT